MDFYKAICIIIVTMLFCSCDEINKGVAKAKEKVATVKEKVAEKIDGDTEMVVGEEKEKKKFSGLRESKHPNGKLKSACMYKDGRREGVCKTFYEDGNLHIEAVYTQGDKDGYFKWFHKNGVVYMETNYKMNRKHGTEKLFWNTGKLKSEMTYFEDKPVMDLKEYTNTGKLVSNYPEIVIREKNTVYFNKEYQLIISLKNYKGKSKDAEVYVGELAEGNYLDHVGLNWLSRDANGNYTYSIAVYPGNAVFKKVSVFAKVITSYGNPLILKKDFNVAVSND